VCWRGARHNIYGWKLFGMAQSADRPGGRRGIAVGTVITEAAVVVRVSGMVDMLTAPTLTEQLSAVLASTPAGLIIDLREVDFLTSAGLEVLVSAHRARAKDTVVAVVADNPIIVRPIKLTGVDQVITLCATMQDAVAAVDGER
jgi:anti-sigma B factor antagonist